MSIWLHVVDKQRFQLIHAINRIVPVEYAEIVATIASQAQVLVHVPILMSLHSTTATSNRSCWRCDEKGKAIIILNPAEPPIIMRDTIHALIEEEGHEAAVSTSIEDMVADVQDIRARLYAYAGHQFLKAKKYQYF